MILGSLLLVFASAFLVLGVALLVLGVVFLIFLIVALILLTLVLLLILGLVLLILVVLLLLLIFLILLLLVLLLLLLLFLELFDLLLHEVAIVFRLGVIGRDLQRGVVGLHRFLPGLDGLLRIRFFGFLAKPVLRVAEVVISALLHRHLAGLEALLKAGRGLRIVAGFVGGGARLNWSSGFWGCFAAVAAYSCSAFAKSPF